MNFKFWGKKKDKSVINWQWSEHPGGYERQLQRRFNNPLFQEARRLVTASDVEDAKIKDKRTMDSLLLKVLEFNDNQPDELPIDWQEYFDETRKKTDELFSEVYTVGGDIEYLVDVLTKYRNRAIGSWKAGISGNAEALKNLEKAELENSKFNFLDNVFVHHASNREYIPIEELGSALLCESTETIQTYCKYLIFVNDEHPIQILFSVAEDIVSEATYEQLATTGIKLSWKDKLDAIESCLKLTKDDLSS